MNEQKGKGAQEGKTERTRTIGRRQMLKAGALGLLAGSVGVARALAGGGSSTGKQKRMAMVIDLRKCVGCHACAVACKAEFNVPLGVWRSWVKQVEQGRYPNTRRFFLPRLCNHCQKPLCVEACPTKASWQREDGAVLVREERCVGCRLCMAACPYDARFYHPETHIVGKCTFCVHRVEQGPGPACVNTCQGRARTFGDLNDPHSEVARLVASQPTQVIKPEMGTEPQVFYIAANQAMFGRVSQEGGKHNATERLL